MKFDIVIIGGGVAGFAAATELQNSGKKCVVISEGLPLASVDPKPYFAAGGEILSGQRVIDGEFEGSVLKSVRTDRLGEVPIEADAFVLATGKFFSRGLCADMDKVYEPVFGLDVEYDEDRSNWFDTAFAARQNFLDFGVKTEGGNALIGGEVIPNLYPAGEVLAGVSSVNGEDAIVGSALEVSKLIMK